MPSTSAAPAPAPVRPAASARAAAPGERPAVRRARPDAARGQGQWALGHREPLNPNERIKKDDDGLHCRARIENIYRHTGFDGIDPSDLRGRFRWWGLYTQRAPGIDGGRTAVLEPEELEDKFFMLRVRVDGGQLTTEALRTIGDGVRSGTPGTPPISPTGRTSSCTGSGSRTSRTSGRPSRVSGCRPPRPAATCLGSSSARRSAGIAADEIIDGTPAVQEIVRPLHRLRGILQPAPQVQDGDLRVAPPGRRARDQRHLLRRRRPPRTRSRVRRLGRRRAVHQPDAGPAAGRLRDRGRGARDLGGRGLDLPRLRLPPAAQPRPAEVPGRRLGHREVPSGAGEPSTCTARSPTARRPEVVARARGTTSACTEQNDGRFYVGVAPTVGRVSGTLLSELADLVEAHGSSRVRPTTDQATDDPGHRGGPGGRRCRRAGRAGAVGQAVDVPRGT